MIKINSKTSIPADKLYFKFSRSGGPGGQNVNKVNSRVTVLFDLGSSEELSENQKSLIFKNLASRIDKSGMIKVVSQKYRTQAANRKVAVKRLEELLKAALKKRPKRKKTAIPYESKLKRLEDKRRRSILKKQRANVKLAE